MGTQLLEKIEICRKLKEKDQRLFNKVIEIEEVATELLEEIKKLFPEYTIHDIGHSNKILSNFKEIIPEELLNKMNKWELFFLICSAFFHDLGMIDCKDIFDDRKFKEYKEGKIFRNDDEARKEFIREYHHIRGEKYINKYWRELRLDNPHQAKIIGKICKGHRKEDLNNEEDYDPEYVYEYGVEKVSINIPLLAFFLRLADKLDLNYERAPLMVYQALGIKDGNK